MALPGASTRLRNGRLGGAPRPVTDGASPPGTERASPALPRHDVHRQPGCEQELALIRPTAGIHHTIYQT